MHTAPYSETSALMLQTLFPALLDWKPFSRKALADMLATERPPLITDGVVFRFIRLIQRRPEYWRSFATATHRVSPFGDAMLDEPVTESDRELAQAMLQRLGAA